MIIIKRTNKKWADEEQDVALQLYYNRVPIKEIAEVFDVESGTMREALRTMRNKRNLEPLQRGFIDPFKGVHGIDRLKLAYTRIIASLKKNETDDSALLLKHMPHKFIVSKLNEK